MRCQHARRAHRPTRRAARPPPEHGGDRFGGHAARPQDDHLVSFERHDGRLDAHLAAPAVHHQLDGARHPVAHMAGGRGAHLAEAVGRRGGQASPERSKDPLGDGVRRHAQRHGVLPAGDRVEDRRAPLEDHRERAGPERLGQAVRLLGDVPCPAGEARSAGQVHDQRVVGGATLGCEHTGHGQWIGGVGGKAVDRLGRHRDDPAGPKRAHREPDRPVAAVDHPGSTSGCPGLIHGRPMPSRGARRGSIGPRCRRCGESSSSRSGPRAEPGAPTARRRARAAPGSGR